MKRHFWIAAMAVARSIPHSTALPFGCFLTLLLSLPVPTRL